jgi:hypothetical protein
VMNWTGGILNGTSNAASVIFTGASALIQPNGGGTLQGPRI